MNNQIFLVDEAGRWIPEANPLTTNRVESWRVELLTLADSSLGLLDGVSGGSFTFNSNAVIRGGGSLEYQGEPIDWLKHRVQPWYKIEAAGKVVEWPVGVFIPATPGTSYGDGATSISIALYDKLHIPDEDKLEYTYSAPKGSNVTDRVRSLLLGIGETKMAITDSEATLSSGMVWDVGTSKLRIINDLLGAINYFSLWVDGYGMFRADPYTRPQDRPITFGFVDDEHGIYSPDFVHEQDLFNIPNKVICIGQSDGNVPAKIGTATNEDPTSPYSFQSRGRWITRTEEGVEATSQGVLDALARRYLAEGRLAGSTFDLEHAPIQIDLNDAVGFRRDIESIDVRGTVETITYSMEVGALCQTKIREVQA